MREFLDYLYEDFEQNGKGLSVRWLDSHCGAELKYVSEHWSSSVDELQAEYGSLAMQVIIANDEIQKKRAVEETEKSEDIDDILQISTFGAEIERKRKRLSNVKAMLTMRRDAQSSSQSESNQAAEYLRTDLVDQVERGGLASEW